MSERRIDAWMAVFDVSEYHERPVAAPPQRVYSAVRRVDLTADRTVRALFAARGLVRPCRRRRYTLDDFVATGFTLLAELTGSEIVLGVTGRFWKASGRLIRLTPPEFTTFAEPGWAQAVWNFHVAPTADGCLLSTETRVRATDEAARRSFRRYWRVVGPLSALVRRRALALIAADARQGST